MRAQLHDGRILEFPDGTDPAVVQATVKKVLGVGAPTEVQTKVESQFAGPFLKGFESTGLGSLLGKGFSQFEPELKPELELAQKYTPSTGGFSLPNIEHQAGRMLGIAPGFVGFGRVIPGGRSLVTRVLSEAATGGAAMGLDTLLKGQFGDIGKEAAKGAVSFGPLGAVPPGLKTVPKTLLQSLVLALSGQVAEGKMPTMDETMGQTAGNAVVFGIMNALGMHRKPAEPISQSEMVNQAAVRERLKRAIKEAPKPQVMPGPIKVGDEGFNTVIGPTLRPTVTANGEVIPQPLYPTVVKPGEVTLDQLMEILKPKQPAQIGPGAVQLNAPGTMGLDIDPAATMRLLEAQRAERGGLFPTPPKQLPAGETQPKAAARVKAPSVGPTEAPKPLGAGSEKVSVETPVAPSAQPAPEAPAREPIPTDEPGFTTAQEVAAMYRQDALRRPAIDFSAMVRVLRQAEKSVGKEELARRSKLVASPGEPDAYSLSKAAELTAKGEWKGAEDALQVGKTTQVPVEPAPADRPTVGGRGEKAGSEGQAPREVPSPSKTRKLNKTLRITGAAIDTGSGIATGPNHPAILERMGFPPMTPEQRNAPEFGFVNAEGTFISREMAARIAKKTGQNLKEFEPDEPAHSDEIAAPGTTTPISETPQPISVPPPAAGTVEPPAVTPPSPAEGTTSKPVGAKSGKGGGAEKKDERILTSKNATPEELAQHEEDMRIQEELNKEKLVVTGHNEEAREADFEKKVTDKVLGKVPGAKFKRSAAGRKYEQDILAKNVDERRLAKIRLALLEETEMSQKEMDHLLGLLEKRKGEVAGTELEVRMPNQEEMYQRLLEQEPKFLPGEALPFPGEKLERGSWSPAMREATDYMMGRYPHIFSWLRSISVRDNPDSRMWGYLSDSKDLILYDIPDTSVDRHVHTIGHELRHSIQLLRGDKGKMQALSNLTSRMIEAYNKRDPEYFRLKEEYKRSGIEDQADQTGLSVMDKFRERTGRKQPPLSLKELGELEKALDIEEAKLEVREPGQIDDAAANRQELINPSKVYPTIGAAVKGEARRGVEAAARALFGPEAERKVSGLLDAAIDLARKPFFSEEFKATRDAIDNIAYQEGVQQGHEVVKEIVTDAKDRQALPFILAAREKGGLEYLRQGIRETLDTVPRNPKHAMLLRRQEALLDRAYSDYDRLLPMAEKMATKAEEMLKLMRESGVDVGEVSGFDFRTWTPQVGEEFGLTETLRRLKRGHGAGQTAEFLKPRVFEHPWEHAINNIEMKMDVAERWAHYVAGAWRKIGEAQWMDRLKVLEDPTIGHIVLPPREVKRVVGAKESIDPETGAVSAKPDIKTIGKLPPSPDYTPVSLYAGGRGETLWVHNDYAGLVQKLFAKPNPNIPLDAILQMQQVSKRGAIFTDTFHQFNLMYTNMTLGRTFDLGYQRGLSLLEYNEATIKGMLKRGERMPLIVGGEPSRFGMLIDQETYDWWKENKPEADFGIKNGLNIGRHFEAVYNDLIHKINIGPFKLGKFLEKSNKYIFESYARGAIMESYLSLSKELREQGKSRLEASREAIHAVNTLFGNIQRQGWFVSPKAQGAVRLLTFAPQWLERKIKAEAEGYADLVKFAAHGPRALWAKDVRLGLMGKNLVATALGWFVASQILNGVRRGKPTWENEEKDHKWDAYIGKVGGKELWFNPLFMAAPMTGYMWSRVKRGDSKTEAAVRMMRNQSSQYLNAALVIGTGKAFDGRPLLTWGEKLKEIGLESGPLPIQARAAFTGERGDPRTAFTSFGIRTEYGQPVSAAAQTIKRQRASVAGLASFVSSRLPPNPSEQEIQKAIRQELHQVPKDQQEDFKRMVYQGIPRKARSTGRAEAEAQRLERFVPAQ